MNRYLMPLYVKVVTTSASEEMELIKKAQEGDEDALSALYEAYFGLIVTVAKNFKNSGLDFADRIQEATSGLLEGIRRYDPEKGAQLATYAEYLMGWKIHKAVANQKMPYLPSHICTKIKKVLEAERKLLMSEKEPTPEEISKETDLDIETIGKLYAYMEGKKTISLDWLLGDGYEEIGIEEILNVEQENEEVLILNHILAEEIEKEINKLPPKQKKIIQLRFGLNGEEPHTQEEVGQIFGYTKANISLIEIKTIKKLRKRLSNKV